MGISIERKLFTYPFADDPTILAEYKDHISYMVRKLDEEYGKAELTLNTGKTEYVINSEFL